MKWKWGAATFALLAACTSPNPNWEFASGGGDAGTDGSFVTDGGPHDGPAMDLEPVCMPGQRTCLAQSGSADCDQGQFKLDRKCPNMSMCMTGYCQPPPQSSTSSIGVTCDVGGSAAPRENDCFPMTGGTANTLSCQPFVDPATKKVSWFCDDQVGTGLPGTACTQGDQCRSGFCGSNGTCFRACLDQMDCPLMGSTGLLYRCELVDIVVEGVKVTAKSCIP